MFESKTDVDRHVEFCLRKAHSESERNIRSFAFAKLYFNVGEFETARRYVSNYLITQPKSAEAQLLLGKILEKMGRHEAALDAYRASLDIDPKQNRLTIKVCELLAANDTILDSSRARFWTEQAQLVDAAHPAVFSLRARLAAVDSRGPEDLRALYLTQLEERPTDVAVRITLLHHLLEHGYLADAYHHVKDIHDKDLSIFQDHVVWYETVAMILVRYQNENSVNTHVLNWEFWMLMVSVLDQLVTLYLDENITNNKNLSECVKALFNLDQTLYIAAENICATCPEKQFGQEFMIHYRAQLCFHLAVLVLKQAKKDQIKYVEASRLAVPLLLGAWHAPPVDLSGVWLEGATEAQHRRAATWHRAAAARCSQAGHVLRALAARDRRASFTERAVQLMAPAWREKTLKHIFITRDQQLKTKSSYFLTCPQLEEIAVRLPDATELLPYDEVAQLVRPGSLHYIIWIGLNNDPVNFRCSVFDGLQYSTRNITNCGAETLSVLDIQAFLYCCVFCTQANIDESKHMIFYNHEKPTVLPVAITEPYGSLNQTKWYASVWRMFRSEPAAALSDTRVHVIKGLEVVRCASTHGLDAHLLVMLATTFAARAAKLKHVPEVEATEARADLYWRTALPLLEKLRNNQIPPQPANRWFEYRGKEMTPTEIGMYIEKGKLFTAQQLMKKKEHEKALQLLSSLKNPYASFYQAQTYKLLADEVMGHNKENVTSEMRSQHIILLSKARDCYYLTLDRLREPSVDRRHPLNTELGTEIEKIERLLSRIDPDTCVNRNECDGMSDENLSSAGSEPRGYSMMHSSYLNGTGHTMGPTTPRHESHQTRREARPSPERLDAQLRQMAAAKDAAVAHILDQNRLVMEAHRTLVDEIRGFKDAVTGLTSSVNELRDIKKSVDELKVAVDDLQNMKEAVEQVYEIKKDLAELKKDTNKLKSSQINEEDLYALEEEYGVDYNINAAGATGFNSAALYPNLQQRFQNTAANTLAYGAPGLYPSLYPMYPYGGLGLSQHAALPFADGHVPDFRALQPPANLFPKVPADIQGGYGKLETLGAPLLPPIQKPPPVNVVITTSDPLPTTSTTQPVLSVTIPPHHLKGNQPPKPQAHNYQIPLPVSTQPTFSNVQSTMTAVPMPVSTQNLLSNVAPPVYSSLTVKSPSQTTNKGLGLQIEKTLTQSFNTSETNKTNTSESSILEEHDPCPDFKPIIPLPDEVPVNTGEEGERVLFCEHAKLYRFVDREWRERGIGSLKLLYNEASGKVRVLMRRDQVHKICANHFLAKDMQLTPMPKNERAYIWAANDFADENVVLEKFCVRFKSPDEGKKFAEAFEKAKTLLKNETEIKKSVPVEVAKETRNNSLGGFVFTSTPTFKPKDIEKVESPAKLSTTVPTTFSSPFASFTFGTPKSTPTSEFKPVQKLETATSPKDSSLISPKPVVKPQTTVPEDQEPEMLEDFTPTTEFKPVIPLPDLIEVKTGEENYEVLYEVKAKLLRFDSTNKEWKERGVGQIKILKDKTIRLLMRREQVHKVCCNHQLLKSMIFTNMPKNNRVLNWCAQDFSENQLKTEMFAIRFRTAELCEEFLSIIQNAQEMLDSSNNVISANSFSSGETLPITWGDKFKPKEGNWECSVCYVNNTDKTTCVACGSNRESTEESSQSPQKFIKPSPASVLPVWADKSSKPKLNTWQCKVCFIHNDGKNQYCEACDSPKNDTVPKKDLSVDLNASGPQFSFGSFGSPETTVTSATTITSGWGEFFKPKVGAWECKACYISNEASALYCIACESPKDDTVPKKESKGLDLGSEQKFSFGIPSTTIGSKPQVSAGFSFGMNQDSTPATGFTFGETTPTGYSFGSQSLTETAPLNLAAPEKTTFTFTLNKPTEKKEGFIFGSPNKHEFEFKPRSPRKVSGSGDAEDSDDDDAEEECDNIYFKPVIPLPDKIEIKTGEEDETVLYCHRAKLYRFTSGEWKERGVGDVKILQHPDTSKLRVLMRREQIHKICLNHTLTKEVEYKAKDDHTWLFSAADYSDGEIAYQQFCLRFKNAEIATTFISAVNKARDGHTEPPVSVVEDDSDSDLEIVYELKVPEDLQEKALELQLPKNFYSYLQKEPCKGCIGCNDDNFVFSSTKSTIVKSETPIFTAKTNTSVFGTPMSSISSNSSVSTPGEASKSTIPTPMFNFGALSLPKTTAANIFAGNGSMLFGSTSVIPVKNDVPTLTSLLTQPSPQEHKSPLAPSKLGTALSSSSIFTGNIFGSAPGTNQPVGNIFGGKPSTASTPPLSQILGSNKSVFGNGSSTFSGTKQETSIFSGTPKIESGNIFRGNIFGGTPQSVFGSNFSFIQRDNSDFGNVVSDKESEPEQTDFPQSNISSTFGSITTQMKDSEPPEKTVFGSISQTKETEVVLKCDTGLSFADLASANRSFTPTETETKPFAFAGAGSLVFSSKKTENKEKEKDTSVKAEADEEQVEEGDDNYDPHYEPIVPLPDAIVVKTGEEDETISFNERAKLYRYTPETKEWKERGVGQIKILHHPGRGTYRLLLRREQVHKLVLNLLITPEIDLQPMQTSDRAWCWAGYNHSEDGSVLEQLAVRFKNVEQAQMFRKAVCLAQNCLNTKPPVELDSSTTDAENEEEQEDDCGSEDSDENRTIMFCKRCTLSYKTDEDGDFKVLGMGVIKMLYDSEMYGGRVEVIDDSGEQLSNTIIAINTVMKVEESSCVWRSMEWSLTEPAPRILRAQFSSAAAAQEMYYNYEEALQYAQHSEIVDNLPH